MVYGKASICSCKVNVQRYSKVKAAILLLVSVCELCIKAEQVNLVRPLTPGRSINRQSRHGNEQNNWCKDVCRNNYVNCVYQNYVNYVDRNYVNHNYVNHNCWNAQGGKEQKLVFLLLKINCIFVAFINSCNDWKLISKI